MAGAVLTLVFLPLGILNALSHAATPWRAAAIVLVGVAAAAGTLLLLAAAGLATAAADPADSWALWQGVLVIVEMSLVGLYAVGVRSVRSAPGRPGRSAPVQSSIQ
jgi:hypothetical protein